MLVGEVGEGAISPERANASGDGSNAGTGHQNRSWGTNCSPEAVDQRLRSCSSNACASIAARRV